ncbi:hypothetical protein [Pseudomonas baltica]|uniref:hypothetical protein n=1 Tax=Pseudomonas baltica TaxID=2762576 RepID=UPI0028975F44|nr:hypothetical protein [Pseudomonas baltica]
MLNWTEIITLVSILVVVVIAMIYTGLIFYIMHSKLDRIESFITSATWVVPVKTMLAGTGWVSRFHRLTLVSLLFLMPAFFIKRGDVDARELLLVPKSLRRLVLGTYMFGIAGVMAATALYLYLWFDGQLA